MRSKKKVKAVETVKVKPEITKIKEIRGFMLEGNNTKIYNTVQEAEQAALDKYLYDLVMEFYSYDGLDWNELITHFKDTPLDREAFIQYLSNMGSQ